MILLFITKAICKQIYDFTTGYKGNELEIYFNHLDIVEVKLEKNMGVFLSYWNETKDLYLKVEAITTKGEILEYGPFDSSSHLMGIVFQTMNYTLHFEYEGIENAQIGMIISKEKFPNYDEFEDKMYEYPSIKYYNDDDFKDFYFKTPFIYNYDNGIFENVVIYLGVIVFGLLFFAIHFLCKEEEEESSSLSD